MTFDIIFLFQLVTWFELYIIHKLIIIEISLKMLGDNSNVASLLFYEGDHK